MISPSLTLYVIRHGECEHNVGGRAAGQDDSPLTATGRKQARINGRLLRRQVGAAIDELQFFASPLHRACSTMELMLEEIGLPPNRYRADRRLMEGDLGDHTWLRKHDMLELPECIADPWNFVHPNGESQAMVHDRVGEFLSSLQSDSVIVTHALPASLIRAHALGLLPEATVGFEMGTTGIMRIAAGQITMLAG